LNARQLEQFRKDEHSGLRSTKRNAIISTVDEIATREANHGKEVGTNGGDGFGDRLSDECSF
jgi:hypothetical protein